MSACSNMGHFPNTPGAYLNIWTLYNPNTQTIVNDYVFDTGAASATISGTVVPSATEADIVAGGKTVIITLLNDTWVASGGVFDAIRQDIINGLDSAQSETFGWNNEVRDKIAVTDVVRTSATIVTITLDAEAAYNITAPETITVTVPSTAVTGALAIVGIPTFLITVSVAANADYFDAYIIN